MDNMLQRPVWNKNVLITGDKDSEFVLSRVLIWPQIYAIEILMLGETSMEVL